MSRGSDSSGLCWFHENLSREAAEELIKKEADEDGTFLIRESTTATGDYVLTLLHQGDVCHYQIRRHGEDAFFSIDDKIRILHGLDSLVNFYREDSHGLVTKLKNFIKKSPPPNHTRSHGVTNLLHRATRQNEKTVITELLKCGYRNIDAKNEDGQTALHLACIHGDEQSVKMFLDANVAVNVMDTEYIPLHYACRHKKSSFFIKMLLDANANIQQRSITDYSVPLHEAAKSGNLEAVKELLKAHAALLPRTKSGEFPIDLAKEKNHIEVVEYLENYKLPPSETYKEQWYHGTLKREEAVKLLKSFANDEDLNNKDQEGASGYFLVRFSDNDKSSGYVLTLLCNDQVKHYKISQSSKYFYIDDGPYLPTLEHLVEHFMRFADGIPVNLKHPVKPKPKPPLPFLSTIPRPSKKKLENPVASLKALDDLLNSKKEAENPLGSVKALDEPSLSKKKAENPSASLVSSSHLKQNFKKPITSQTLGHKKKTINTGFNSTLRRLTSPRKNKLDKNVFLGTTNKNLKDDCSTKLNQKSIDPALEVQAAQAYLKSLSFSTPFTNDANEVYNIPKNNAAVVNDFEIGLEKKTQQEIEYLTKSDIAIERERLEMLNNNVKTRKNLLTDDNGYVPTVDIRVFVDQDSGTTSKSITEKCSTELRSLTERSERRDDFTSSVLSTESDMNRYFNLQNNTNCTITDLEHSVKHNYFIPIDCLELQEVIGKGEFGEVYKGNLIRKTDSGDEGNVEETRWQVAIKTLRDERCRASKEEFLREASVMTRLHHHCIVQLIGISKGESLMMIQELVSFGSMLQYIVENRSHINPNFELKLWASQIACGMEYLESQHFVHRDLAARNILLASRNQAKISDFGLSRALDSGNECYQASQGGKWPIKWYAPESFKNGIFSHASDVWSFGVALWEMFSLGEPPYGDIRGVQVINLIENGERLPQPLNCPNQVYEIMKNCWNYKPKDRPSFRFLTEFFAKDPDYQNICELVKTDHIG